MLTIKILGSCCANCDRLEDEVRAALAGTGIEHQIVKVTDYADIMSYGVLSTPALVMNETIMSVGRIPRRDLIVDWARQMQSAN